MSISRRKEDGSKCLVPVKEAINPRDAGEGRQYVTEVAVYEQRGDYKGMLGLIGGGGLSD